MYKKSKENMKNALKVTYFTITRVKMSHNMTPRSAINELLVECVLLVLQSQSIQNIPFICAQKFPR